MLHNEITAASVVIPAQAQTKYLNSVLLGVQCIIHQSMDIRHLLLDVMYFQLPINILVRIQSLDNWQPSKKKTVNKAILLDWIKKTQFRLAQIEIQSSRAVNFVTIQRTVCDVTQQGRQLFTIIERGMCQLMINNMPN